MSTETKYLYGIPYQDLPKYKAKEAVGNKVVPAHKGINYELLDEILSFIKAHPQTWVQDSWYKNVDPETGFSWVSVHTEEVTEENSCGTSFCFAGHTAIHEGFPSPPMNNTYPWTRQVQDGEDTYTQEANDFARDLLGLDYDQADALFDSENSLQDLDTMIQVLHLYPNIKGYKMDSIRDNELSVEQVVELVKENPNRWLENGQYDDDED